MGDYMKKPCEHCPYRNDVKPFLTPERGEELAYHALNPYNTFPCHKTTEYDDSYDDNDYEGDDMMVVETSKECAGFLTLMAKECGEDRTPEGFKPSYDICYPYSEDMIDAYDEENS